MPINIILYFTIFNFLLAVLLLQLGLQHNFTSLMSLCCLTRAL